MEILSFLFVVIWLLPMFVSMGCDRNTVATFSATLFGNLIAVGMLMLSNWLRGVGWVYISWCIVVAIPIVYYTIWTLSSETFGGHLLNILRLGPAPQPKKSKSSTKWKQRRRRRRMW